jgi:hypothetical protein
MGNDRRARIHEYLSFRAAVKTDAGTAAAAHTDESKVRFARQPPAMSERNGRGASVGNSQGLSALLSGSCRILCQN